MCKQNCLNRDYNENACFKGRPLHWLNSFVSLIFLKACYRLCRKKYRNWNDWELWASFRLSLNIHKPSSCICQRKGETKAFYVTVKHTCDIKEVRAWLKHSTRRMSIILKQKNIKINFTKNLTTRRMKTTTKGGTLNPFFNVARNDIAQKREGLNVFCFLDFLYMRDIFCAIIIILRPLCLRRVFLPRGLFSFRCVSFVTGWLLWLCTNKYLMNSNAFVFQVWKGKTL